MADRPPRHLKRFSSPPVSYLFVPGSRGDRFEKALASGADRVILDLEDALDHTEKDEARKLVEDTLVRGLSAAVLVRLNSPDSPWFEPDLAMLREVLARNPSSIAGLVLPKLEFGETVDLVRTTVGAPEGREIIGLVETAVGVQAADSLSTTGVTRLAVGAVDLSVDIGGEVDSPLLDVVYARIVLASRVAGIDAPLGSPPLQLHDTEGIAAAARRLKSMGVAGQLCIHPRQIGPVHEAFAPSDDEIAWAHRVVESVGGAVQVDGQMVDRPVRDRAERILEAAAKRKRNQ